MDDVQRWKREYADYYAGTKEELVSAGAAKQDWFPRKLERQWRRDGKPFMANTGRTQRIRRIYRVEGREPRTTLTCRPGPVGVRRTLLWTVEIRVSDEERERRKAAQTAKWARSCEEAEQLAREIQTRVTQYVVEHQPAVKEQEACASRPTAAPSEHVRQRAMLEAANLSPIAQRLAGVSGLFRRAESELKAKLDAIRGAHEYSNRFRDLEGLEDIRESLSECADSAKLGRAIEDLEAIRSGLAGIVRELKRLTDGGASA